MEAQSFVTGRYRCSKGSGTLEADGNMHFVFIRYGASAILIHHNNCQQILAHSGDPIYLTSHISLASDSLARVGLSPRQPLGPSKRIENVS